MEKETVLRLADMCGLTPWVKHEFSIDRLIPATDEGIDGDFAGLMQFAQLVAAHEREQCAKVCETHAPTTTPTWVSYAAAIRARGT